MIRNFSHTIFLCLFLILVAIVLSAPFGILFQEELQTGIVLVTVWYWSLYRPHPFQLLAIFISGLVIELFRDGPAGVLLLWMLVSYGVANGWRSILSRTGFIMTFLAFAVVMLGEGFIEWCLMSLRALTFLSPLSLIFQYALTLAIYLVLYGVFLWGRENFDRTNCL